MPRKLSLVVENGKYRLVQKPVFAENIQTKILTLNASELSKEKTIEMPGNSYRLAVSIDLANAKGISIDLLKNDEEKSVLTYDVMTQMLSFDRTKSGKIDFNKKFPSIEKMRVIPQNGILKLDVFVDNSIVEVFANDGKSVLTDLVFPSKKGGSVVISLLK